MFTVVFEVHGGHPLVADLAGGGTGLSPEGVVLQLLAIVFLAGFLLDRVSTVSICLPILPPILAEAKIDPSWFAALVVVVVQISGFAPPVVPSISYRRSIAQSQIGYGHGVQDLVPSVAAQLLTLAFFYALPALAIWLPKAPIRGF